MGAEFADSYKATHKGFMEKDVTNILANMTPRSTKYWTGIKHGPNAFDGKVVVFGLQYFVLDYMIKEWNKFFKMDREQAIAKYKRVIGAVFGIKDLSHLEELHDLGYLPIEIKALPEGSVVDIKVPFLTVQATDDKYAWLVTYIESVLSTDTWKLVTVATIARQLRQMSNRYALMTTGTTETANFQNHDFSFRGMSGRHDAQACGAAFNLFTNGTDNIASLYFLEEYYGVDFTKDFIATSVPASEHALASTGIAIRGELETYRKWITQDYPTGIVSIVSDTLDFFRVITDYAKELKQDILNRQPDENGLAKVVFRPDSGDPVEIVTGIKHGSFEDGKAYIRSLYKTGKRGAKFILQDNLKEISKIKNVSQFTSYDLKSLCDDLGWRVVVDADGTQRSTETCEITNYRVAELKGAIETLWDEFGGTVTEQGYKVLNERVGLIYGDGITFQRAEQIFERLVEKGFATTNLVFGIGSYTLQNITRDTLGIAIKCTAVKHKDEWIGISKDPITDDGTKKSAIGLIRVEEEDGKFVLYDHQTPEQEKKGALRIIFKNGFMYNHESFVDIRERAMNTI